jgi:predicted metal-dependent hydrolase
VLLKKQDEFLEQNDEVFANFWLWHAIEESEHRAVCFDVYEHIFGKGLLSYLHRVCVMAGTSIFFIISVAIGFNTIRFKDKILNLLQRLKGSQVKQSGWQGSAKLSALFTGVTPSMYFDYYRRSFHPFDTDCEVLIERWKVKRAVFGLAAGISEPTAVTLPTDFDAETYQRLNPDVAAAGVDPVEHYLCHGHSEGRVYRGPPHYVQ